MLTLKNLSLTAADAQGRADIVISLFFRENSARLSVQTA